MSSWIFLSHSYSIDTPGYGGQDSFSFQYGNRIDNGDSCNTSYWAFSNHLGTHIDFPRHFYNAGKTLNDYDVSFWHCTNICIRDLSPIDPCSIIEPEDLDLISIPEAVDVILIKTGFGQYRQNEKYWKLNPGLSPRLAQLLKKRFKHLKMIGLDSISISSFSNRALGREAHKAFLAEPDSILLIEDMDLHLLSHRTCIKRMLVSPLRVDRADGSPCTIFAEIDNNPI